MEMTVERSISQRHSVQKIAIILGGFLKMKQSSLRAKR